MELWVSALLNSSQSTRTLCLRLKRKSIKPYLTFQSVPIIASNKHCLLTSVIFRFPHRFKLPGIQLVSVKALHKYFIPLSPNSLSLMSKPVNVQFLLVKASGRSFNTLSPNLLWLTFKLVNLQLLPVRMVNKSTIPSSPNLLQMMFKLATDLILVLISASHKCFNLVFSKKVPVTVELVNLELTLLSALHKCIIPSSPNLWSLTFKLVKLHSPLIGASHRCSNPWLYKPMPYSVKL